GLTTPNLMEAETNRALVASAQELVVLADHTKFGKVGLSTIVELRDVDTLVTDAGVDPEAVEAVEDVVGELIVVPADGSLEGGPAGRVASNGGFGPYGARSRGRIHRSARSASMTAGDPLGKVRLLGADARGLAVPGEHLGGLRQHEQPVADRCDD